MVLYQAASALWGAVFLLYNLIDAIVYNPHISFYYYIGCNNDVLNESFYYYIGCNNDVLNE